MWNNLTKKSFDILSKLYDISMNHLGLSYILDQIKFYLYNLLISKYTTSLYKNFLQKIPENSYVLDIGIGNAYALLQNSELIIKKKINIVGLDIDLASINIANNEIQKHKLNELIEARCINIYEYTNDKKFDYVYFSNSYSVIPGVDEMINYISDNLIKDDGNFVVSTTLDNRTSYIKELIKPRIKNLMFDIDFGNYIVLENFINKMIKNNLIMENIENVHQNWLPIWGNIDIFTCFFSKKKSS